jgi:outer membrane receptor protein involved in Fe transport
MIYSTFLRRFRLLAIIPPLLSGAFFFPHTCVQASELELDEAELSTLLNEDAEEGLTPLAANIEVYRNQVQRTPSNVFVITREQIRAINPKHPAEMLRYVPGFVVLRKGPTSYEISTFGTGGSVSNKVLLLLDGHRVLSPEFGSPIWNLIPMVQDDLDRIEVRLGPESNLFGSNAFGAVVNFITRDPETNEEQVTARVGSDSLHQLHWVSSRRDKRGGTHLLVSSEHFGSNDPYTLAPSLRPDPAFPSVGKQTQSTVRLRRQSHLSPTTELDFSVGVVRSDNTGVIPAFRVQQSSSTSASSSLHLSLDLDHAISLSRHLEFHGSYQRIHIRFGTPPFGLFGVPENEQSTSQGEVDLRYRWEPGPWRLTTGTSYRNVGLATPFNTPIPSQGTGGIYLRGERELGRKWSIFAGVRRIFQEASENLTSWKAASLYRPHPNLGFRFSIGNSFRAPDYFAQFLRPTSVVSSAIVNPAAPPTFFPLSASLVAATPDLRSEGAERFIQVGIEKKWKGQSAKLDFYRSSLLDTIKQVATGPFLQVFTPAPVTIPFRQHRLANQSERHVRGIIFAYQKSLARDFQLSLGMNFQDLDAPDSAVPDPYAPPRSATLVLYRPAKAKRIGGSVSLRAVDQYGISPTFVGAGYGLVDLNLERELSQKTSLSLTIRNLLDHKHFEVSDIWVRVPGGSESLRFGREVFLSVSKKL